MKNMKKVHFNCPHCGSRDNYVSTVVLHPKGHSIRRYRRCNNCNTTFRTFQKAERLDNSSELWSGDSYKREGTQNGNAVFTEQNIIEMRKFREQGMTYPELAKMYGCGCNTIGRIVRRESYKNVV